MPRTLLLSALLSCALCPTARAAAPASQREAAWVIVVANNRSLDRAVTPLRYADDDGARWYELLSPIATRASLFTVFDDESQRVFRSLAPRAEPPTRAALMARLAEYNREMEQAAAAGVRPSLYLVLVGHGEVDASGAGFLSLLDGPLGRAQLFHDLIAPSKAAFNHVIIDACNAWLLVSKRGDDRGAGSVDAIRRYVADEELERHPGTGVLLATSRAQATHEWSVFGGGVFSHQLRSALAGAADVNGDGRIEYSEVRAFVAAANLKVDDPRARLDVYVHAPPLDRARPLVDFGAARYRHYLRLAAGVGGRVWLEDARGVRYLDVNKAPDRPLLLALVDSDRYFVRSDRGEAGLRLGAPGTVEVAPSQLVPRAVQERGPVEDSFHRHLFEVTFDPPFYRGLVASSGDLPVLDPPPRRFVPPPDADAGSLGADALAQRLTSARERIAELGLRSGDDSLTDVLVPWADGRLAASDLREADRALAALEHRVTHLVVDEPLVRRKLERARAQLGKRGTALEQRLDEVGRALDRHEPLAANRLVNLLLDEKR